jgi:hypothetical protein
VLRATFAGERSNPPQYHGGVRLLLIVLAVSACSFNPAMAVDDARATGDSARDDVHAVADAGHATITLVASADTNAPAAITTASSTYPSSISVPTGDDLLLLVFVGIGSQLGDLSVASITGVTFGSTPMIRVATILGTPIAANLTRSELWELAAPSPGTAMVTVSTSEGWHSLHLGTLVFSGVDASTPVRDNMTADGFGTSSSVAVATMAGDLVVDAVGQGSEITAPGTNQSSIFVDDVSDTTTLDNTAMSTAPGSPSPLTMTWTFGTSDEWQTIAASLVPAAS